VDIALEAPIAVVRAKSVAQTTLFAELVAQECAGHGLVLASPTDPARRGSQVCFAHPEAYPIMQALIARGVIGDFRAPDILRFGITPLYLRYADLWEAVQILRSVLASGEWREARFNVRNKVT
jgi:kynureninase